MRGVLFSNLHTLKTASKDVKSNTSRATFNLSTQVVLHKKCWGRGEIGIHAALRTLCRKV